MLTRKAAESATAAVTRSADFFMSVYTRTGDRGKTSLYQGKRVSKASLRVEAYGSVDELNSAIGVSLADTKILRYKEIKDELIRIQNDLFEIGAALANPHSTGSGQASSKVSNLGKRVFEFENIIDDLTKKLPQLSNFILPGGGKAGSMLHFSRTVARRCERRIVELSEKDPSAGSGQGNVESSIIIYINRLSDLLFMFARFINYKEKKKEVIWKNR